MMKKILIFLKKEVVLCVAGLLAIATSFLVLPDRYYIEYIDFRVLSLLFCLMLVVEGFKSEGFFKFLATKLLKKASNTRSLTFILVSLCFISSMFITNDVALITFVPFACLILEMSGRRDKLIFVIVLQTIAANLGSMLTPIGNPQNLYLYSYYNMSVADFILRMLPLYILAAVLLCAVILTKKKEPLSVASLDEKQSLKLGHLILLTLCFLVCILCVARVMPYYIMLALIVAVFLLYNHRLLKNVDYMLLITFVFFFVFIGNMQRIPAVAEIIRKMIDGRELIAGVLLSQIISNVPAAVLLSGFTDNAHTLLVGVNIGGLGTLIASLASIISYRAYGATKDADKGSYIKEFSIYNILFLACMTLFSLL